MNAKEFRQACRNAKKAADPYQIIEDKEKMLIAFCHTDNSIEVWSDIENESYFWPTPDGIALNEWLKKF